MKLSRIGLLLALPACAASGLSPSTAWAGKFARAAERIQAVVPESLKPATEAPAAVPAATSAGQAAPQAAALPPSTLPPGALPPAATAPAVAADPAADFSITVTPVLDDEPAAQKLVDAARPRPTPDHLSTPEAAVNPEAAAEAPFAPPATAAAPRNVPTLAPPQNVPTLAPPRFPTPGIATQGEPNLLPTAEPVANRPESEVLESLAHKRAVAGPNTSPAASPVPASVEAAGSRPAAMQLAPAATAAAPQLLTPGTNSEGLQPVVITPGGPTHGAEQGFGHNALRDAGVTGAPVYRNILREGSTAGGVAASPDDQGIEQTAGRRRAGFLGAVSAARPAGTSAAGTPANPGAAANPAAAAATVGKSAPNSPQTAAPTASPSATKSPVATSASPATRPGPSISNPPRGTAVVSDREPGSLDRKSVIGTQPADRKSQQMFETEEEPRTLTPDLELLRKRVQTALAYYYQNWTLNTREHSPWEVMHAIIAYGVDTRLVKGSERTTAIGHLCFSGICNNQPILTIREGKLYALRGPGVQGHSGQFLAILAQSYLQRDYPLYVGGEKYTLEDLIKAEQDDCESGTELTFKLIGLMHYLPSDATWTNFQGQTWSLDRLVREEIVQPVRGAACGGTHRLMGLSYAIRKREQRGEPISGIYLEARKYIEQYHKYTFSLQNQDGSFSTAWFVRPEARNDLDRRMQTTGHILEWLCFSLSDEQLRDPRVVRSVRYVTDLLLNQNVNEWEIGHLGHALHALQIYNERVFGGPVRSFEGLVTRRPAKTARAPTMGTGGMGTAR